MIPSAVITIRFAAGSLETGAPQLPTGTVGGTVIATANGLAVRAGAVRIPLPADSPLVHGQAVTVTRPEAGGAIEVRASAATQTSPNRDSQLIGVIAHALARIQGAADRTPQSLLPLLPTQAPLSEAQVRQIVALFTVRGALGPNLALLAGHIEAAMASGWAGPEWAQAFLEMARTSTKSSPRGTAEWIRSRVRAASATAEGALASSTPEDAFEGLLTQIRTLQNDAVLRSALRGLNRDPAFGAQAQETADRLESCQMAQLHALDSHYVFAELPAPFPGESSSLQLHWSQGRKQDGAAPDEPDCVALDLSLSQLGDLWVTVQASQHRCQCTLRATQASVIDALALESPALEKALLDAGYLGASVRVGAWDGDRLEAVCQLMRRNAGLDLKA